MTKTAITTFIFATVLLAAPSASLAGDGKSHTSIGVVIGTKNGAIGIRFGERDDNDEDSCHDRRRHNDDDRYDDDHDRRRDKKHKHDDDED